MRVLIKHSFIIEEEWPESSANKEHIEFAYNSSTGCADNIIDRLVKYKDRLNLYNDCLCKGHHSEFIKVI